MANDPARADSYQLSDRYARDEGTVFMTGLQALARLPIDQLRADRLAGLRTAAFVSGYPGSPLGGYDQEVGRALRQVPDLPIVHRPAVNEEYAATAVMGSQLAALQPDARYEGVVGIWYGKAPGVDRASDALRHAVFAGTDPRGGALALVGDDPQAKSSTVPSSSAGTLADLHIPVLYPGDPAEALDLGRHAIALSRITGLWTSLKIVADVADGSGTVHLHPERIRPVVPLIDGRPYEHQPDGRILTPHTVDLEREIYEVRYALAIEYASSNQLNRATVDPSDAWIGLVSSGITYREVREALRRMGLTGDAEIASAGIRLLKLQMPIPFNPETMREFARGLEEIFVIEEKHPNVESLLKDALYNHAHRPLVVGKHDERGRSLLPGHGSLGADDIIPALRRRLGTRLGERLAPEPPAGPETLKLGVQRTPFYCSGCPHNRSTLAPPGALVGVGIGCHTMALLMDPERVGQIAGITCMGNEGTQWIGMAEFVERGHMFQNLGDGTYFHSGQLAIQAAVAAGVSITYKLLWNGAVAMTGGQEAQGRIGVPEVVRVLLAQGVARVRITTEEPARYRGAVLPAGVDVWDRTRLLEAQQSLAAIPGVTVLIHDQACAAETRRARKRGQVPTPARRVAINHRLCEGCGDCGRVSGCLSVQPHDTAFGRKTRIDQTSCNLDYSCLEGDCPSFVTVEPPGPWTRRLRRWLGRDRAAAATRGAAPAPPADLPDPDLVVSRDDFAVRITGIGGTGVVTVSQVLGTAAMFDGFEVRGLDQIGLSQKAGPVVSDLSLRRGALEPTTNRLGRGQADLILAFDQLVAASDTGLRTAEPGHTAVVGSRTPVPTGAMITHPEIRLPDEADLEARIARFTRPGARHWADAGEITATLYGDSVTANLFVVGMAVQAGCLPLEAASIERAIELNGVAVERNRDAFRWGRVQVADPAAVTAAVAAARAARPVAAGVERPLPRPLPARLASRVEALAGDDAALAEELGMLATELVAYQSAAYSSDWLDTLEQVAAREREVAPGSTRLLASVARALFKLMAYKDEYEIARLMLDADGLAAARELAGGDGVITWRLHPPQLRTLLKRKLGIGPWATPLVRLLARLRPLRGTPLDPFGRAEMRRLERELVAEYREALQTVLRELDAESLDAAIVIAELPDAVRGYEDIKLANMGRYREQLRASLAELAGTGGASEEKDA